MEQLKDYGQSDADLRTLAQKIGKVKAMAFDIDGTIAAADGEVKERTVNALANLAEHGIEPIIVTGRIFSMATQPLAKLTDKGIVISCNGTLIGNTAGEIFYAQPIDVQTSTQLIQTARELKLIAIPTLADKLAIEVRNLNNPFTQGEYIKFPIEVCDLDTIDPQLIYGFMLAHPKPEYLDQVTEELMKRFPNMQRSMDNFFDIVADGEGKEKGLRLVGKKIGINLTEIAGFGDGGNDVKWLKEVGFPIAMSNARDEVKEICCAQIGHHDEYAIARFIENYLAEMESGNLL